MATRAVKKTGAGLNEEQVRFFRTFGFITLRDFFTTEQVQTIHREIDVALDEQYHDQPWDGQGMRNVNLLDDSTPFCSGLIEDRRCLGIAEQLYKDDGGVLGSHAQATIFPGDSHWHRDTKMSLQRGVKMGCYLDHVDADSGALRVVPSSHWIPRVYDDNDALWEGIVPMPIEQVPCHVLKMGPGDLVAFDHRIWHGTCGGAYGRRMLAINYIHNPQTKQETVALCQQGEHASRLQRRAPFGRRYIFPHKWLDNPKGNPDRQRWLDRLHQINYFDTPGLVEP